MMQQIEGELQFLVKTSLEMPVPSITQLIVKLKRGEGGEAKKGRLLVS